MGLLGGLSGGKKTQCGWFVDGWGGRLSLFKMGSLRGDPPPRDLLLSASLSHEINCVIARTHGGGVRQAVRDNKRRGLCRPATGRWWCGGDGAHSYGGDFGRRIVIGCCVGGKGWAEGLRREAGNRVRRACSRAALGGFVALSTGGTVHFR